MFHDVVKGKAPESPYCVAVRTGSGSAPAPRSLGSWGALSCRGAPSCCVPVRPGRPRVVPTAVLLPASASSLAEAGAIVGGASGRRHTGGRLLSLSAPRPTFPRPRGFLPSSGSLRLDFCKSSLFSLGMVVENCLASCGWVALKARTGRA